LSTWITEGRKRGKIRVTLNGKKISGSKKEGREEKCIYKNNSLKYIKIETFTKHQVPICAMVVYGGKRGTRCGTRVAIVGTGGGSRFGEVRREDREGCGKGRVGKWFWS
jgi:hypothetical protein